jgi:PAS domain S-box-containing protein
MNKEEEFGGPAALRSQLGAIFAVSHDAIVGLSAAGVVETWNPAAADLYGYTSEEIIGSQGEVLVALKRRDAENAVWLSVMNGEAVEEYQVDRVAKDGSFVAVTTTTTAILDEVGSIVGVLTVSRRRLGRPEGFNQTTAGIDEGRPADYPKGPRLAQIVQGERLEVLGRLAGGVAHDFNNLLGVILNYAAFVAEQLQTIEGCAPECVQRCEDAKRDVEQVERAARRAADLTHQLLAFARREVVRPQVLDLNDGVSRTEELLRRTLGEDIELSTSLSGDLWPVLADPGQIEQVLLNLAINASDAMPEGGALHIDTANITVGADSAVVTIEEDSVVGTGPPAAPGQYVRLRVSDSGEGMSADVMSHAFDPFYTTKGAGSGTGLGLATVYGIVTESDATITVTSELDVGTTFTILFPVTEEATVVVPEDAPYQRTPAGETVLVVEDEEALRDMTERIFIRNGYKVLTAANGADALAVVAGHAGAIHLLLTDVVMPQMLGKEVAERVRALRPDIEVLFMSGYAHAVLASQGRLEPGVVLLDKPFTEAELIKKAGQVLNGHFKGYATVTP